MRIDALARWVALLVAVGLTALAPMQSDSWWHLRTGAEIVARGEIPATDVLSYAAEGRPWPNHEWLAQVVFHGVWRVGGLPLLTLLCALLATLGIVPSIRWLRGPWAQWLALFVVAFPAYGFGVSVRPQVFTLAAFGGTVAALAAFRRPWALVPLFALWANLHGGVALGGLLMVTACAVAFLHDRERLPQLLTVTAACGAATLLNPMGPGLLLFPIASVSRLKALGVGEWQAPGLDLLGATLVAGMLALGVLTWTRRESLRRAGWTDALLVGSALVFALPAAMSARNLPYFVLLGLPAVSRLLSAADPEPDPDDKPRLNAALAVGGGALAVAAIGAMYRLAVAALAWDPLPPQAIAALHAAPEPLFTTYDTGGYVLWFAPERQVFLDSRQDPFPIELIEQAVAAETDGDPHPLFDAWRFRSAFVYRASPLGDALLAEGWLPAYEDDDWRVLHAP